MVVKSERLKIASEKPLKAKLNTKAPGKTRPSSPSPNRVSNRDRLLRMSAAVSGKARYLLGFQSELALDENGKPPAILYAHRTNFGRASEHQVTLNNQVEDAFGKISNQTYNIDTHDRVIWELGGTEALSLDQIWGTEIAKRFVDAVYQKRREAEAQPHQPLSFKGPPDIDY